MVCHQKYLYNKKIGQWNDPWKKNVSSKNGSNNLKHNSQAIMGMKEYPSI